MQGGNGHKPVDVVRGILPWQRAKPPPRGPFTGAMVVHVLEGQGWMPDDTKPDEWMVWRHIVNSELVLVNPYWEEIWEGDAVFRCLYRQMGLSSEELVRLLESLL